MKIYTKTGDKGTTRLVDGSCVEKFNPRVEAYGTTDELNSYLGIISSLLHSEQNPSTDIKKITQDIARIQNQIFVIGSLLATADDKVSAKLPPLHPEEITWLEQRIDQMTDVLPALKNFILPTGALLSSHTHYARTLCRRAERRSAEVLLKEITDSPILIYLNRLSDYLFTLARYFNFLFQHEDIPWTTK